MAERSMSAIDSKFAVSVTTSAQTIVVAGFTAAQIDLSDALLVSVETVKVRYSVTAGITPTTSAGHPIGADAQLLLRGRELIRNFQMIAATGTASVHMTLFSWS